MRKLLLVSLLIPWSLTQAQDSPDFQPFFSAVVVKDVTVSAKWYQSVFGLKLKTEMNDPNQSYKIIMLESSNYLLEILQLKGSLAKEELVKGKPTGTEIQGHFKVGFRIRNIENYLARLKSLGIDVPQVWTDATTGKKNFIIKDPDGNLIQFFEV